MGVVESGGRSGKENGLELRNNQLHNHNNLSFLSLITTRLIPVLRTEDVLSLKINKW